MALISEGLYAHKIQKERAKKKTNPFDNFPCVKLRIHTG